MLATLTLAAATAIPTIAIGVRALPDVPRPLVTLALEEARAIWRAAGVRLVWRTDGDGAKDGAVAAAAPGAVGLDLAVTLRVVIDDEPGTAPGDFLAAGWVIFEGGEPRPEIHLSRANVFKGLERACPVGALSRLTQFHIDEVVAVALGRTLAHELGHYLLGVKVHSGRGLMRAEWSPTDLYGDERPDFRLTAEQREVVASKCAATLTTKP